MCAREKTHPLSTCKANTQLYNEHSSKILPYQIASEMGNHSRMPPSFLFIISSTYITWWLMDKLDIRVPVYDEASGWWLVMATCLEPSFSWRYKGDFAWIQWSQSIKELTHSPHGTRTCDLQIRGSSGHTSYVQLNSEDTDSLSKGGFFARQH